MYLVVGLGNPDKQYANTFHNMGFMCLDALASKLGATFNKGECCAVTAHTIVGGQKVILAKPVTYMNLSGKAVQELCHKYKIEQGHLAVVYDDKDIPLGSTRIRQNGSAGSHNGMKNIIQLLGTDNFVRVRVGIGKDTPMRLMDFVLSQVTEQDHLTLDVALDNCAQALQEFVKGEPIDVVMQRHNKIASKSEEK